MPPDATTIGRVLKKVDREELEEVFRNWVSTKVEGKNLVASLALLSSHTSTFHLTQAPFPRAASVESLAPLIKSKNIILNPDLSLALDEAYHMASKRGEVLLVTGTFHIMDPIKQNIRIS